MGVWIIADAPVAATTSFEPASKIAMTETSTMKTDV
jgi:hypothetical protein